MTGVTAEQLTPRGDMLALARDMLATRRRHDPRSVKLGKLTAEQARWREAALICVVDTLSAIIDGRAPVDPEDLWIDSAGARGLPWPALRADLNEAERRMADMAAKDLSNLHAREQAAVMAAIRWHFQPAVPGGTTPRIVFAADIERTLRTASHEARRLAA